MADDYAWRRCVLLSLWFGLVACNESPARVAHSQKQASTRFTPSSTQAPPKRASPSDGTPEPTSAPSRRFRYEIHYSTFGTAELELRLNGAVVLDDSEASTGYGTGRVSPWVKAGRNVVDARVLPEKPDPRALGNPPQVPELELTVSKVLPDSREVLKLAELRWPGQGTPSLPADVHMEFNVVDDVPGCRLFLDAEPLDGSPQTERAVATFARELHAAYARRDLKALKALRRYHALEQDRCAGNVAIDPDPGLDAYVAHMSEQRRWNVIPLAPTDPRLELLPDRRIYRVSRAGDPLIYVEQDDGLASYAEVFIARIDGQLTWVR